MTFLIIKSDAMFLHTGYLFKFPQGRWPPLDGQSVLAYVRFYVLTFYAPLSDFQCLSLNLCHQALHFIIAAILGGLRGGGLL